MRYSDRGRTRALAFVVVALMVFMTIPAAAMGAPPTWYDWGSNPIYDWGSSHRAYYPSVLYSATGFDGNGKDFAYKMYYDDGGETWLAYSHDGETWERWGLAPVLAGDWRHPQVLYDAGAFGDSAGDLIQASSTETYAVDPYYKGWFWEAGNGSLVRFAYSADGEFWHTDYPLDVCPPDEPGWQNPGSPVYDLHVMYDGGTYRGWADNNGRIYNVSSSDGTTWTLDSPAVAVDLGSTSPTVEWDSSSLSRVAVVKTSPTEWHLWYGGAGKYDWNAASGGGGNMGIGYASSTDGLNWTKDTGNNPIASIGGGGTFNGYGPSGTFNDERNYAMSVLYDPGYFGANGTAAIWKMWRSGRDTSGVYSLGFATSEITETPTSLTCEISDTEVPRGAKVAVWGRLSDAAGRPIGGPGRTVTLWAGTGDTTPTGSPTMVGTATYDPSSDVYWAHIAPSARYTAYELRYAGDATYQPAMSPDRLVETVATDVERISGYDRYEVAVNLAKEGWPGYVGVRHVILAAGEDRAAADPLTASGLSGIYDAPLLLVWGTNPKKEINSTTRVALQNIVAANPGQTIYVHIVGGPVSVPTWVQSEIRKLSPRLNVNDRVSGSDRYAVAYNIAERMQAVLGPAYPKTAFVTNGENSAYFYNALAAAPSSARQDFPVILSRNTYLPRASWAKADYDSFYVVGSTPAVPESIRSSLGATRINGSNRYVVASNMAAAAIARGWLGDETVAVANKLPDAITGGSGLGKLNGPILYTDAAPLNTTTKGYLAGHADEIRSCYVLGGPKSITEPTLQEIKDALGAQ